MTEDKICPFMSGFVSASTYNPVGFMQPKLSQVVCLKEQCMAYKTFTPIDDEDKSTGGYCKLIDRV